MTIASVLRACDDAVPVRIVMDCSTGVTLTADGVVCDLLNNGAALDGEDVVLHEYPYEKVRLFAREGTLIFAINNQ